MLNKTLLTPLHGIQVESWAKAMWLAECSRSLATCPRRSVAALFLDAERVVRAWGVNTAPPGQPTCLEAGCVLEKDEKDPEGRCIRTLHAEQSALADLLIRGYFPAGMTVVTTCRPCHVCARLLASWQIGRLVYAGAHPEGWTRQVLEGSSIEVIRLDEIDGRD